MLARTFSTWGKRRPVDSLYARTAVHLAWWGLFVAFEHFTSYVGWRETPLIIWGFIAKDVLAAAAGFYFFSEVVLPRWLLQRRWLLTVLGLAVIYYTWALLSYAYFTGLLHYGLAANSAGYMHRILDQGLWRGVFAWYGVSIGLNDFTLTVLPPILVRFVQFLLASSNRSLRLERENLHLEVNFLKAQINPHFLFNTLNNLYTMVVKQDARAPDMVQHLAALMHYTVYQAQVPLVPLAQELGFLEAYLELERLRYGHKVRIDYRQTGAPAGWGLTPLLFFPFVENAFKHGVDSSLDASWVAIEMAVRGAELHFAVRNSFSPGAPKRAFGGVGIANVQKRLALHYAPADYQLTIEQTADTYRVALMLRLGPLADVRPAPAVTFLATT